MLKENLLESFGKFPQRALKACMHLDYFLHASECGLKEAPWKFEC